MRNEVGYQPSGDNDVAHVPLVPGFRKLEVITSMCSRVLLTTHQAATMATKLPPPKRQKSNYAKSLEAPVVPEPAAPVPSIVVQFKNAENGSNLGPAINLPADTARDALQMLVNKLKGEVSSIKMVSDE